MGAGAMPSILPSKQSCWITSLKASNFRCYEALAIQRTDPQPIILTGPNGAGKTNILEVISLLAPGRGFRKSKLSQLTRYQNLTTPWNIHATITLSDGTISVSTGLDRESEKERRILKINGAPQPQKALHEWFRIIWQTPQSDCLFLEGMGTRRRFIDTLISQIKPWYAEHLYRYDHALRERSRLLKEGISDDKWLKILEETIAQEAVVITSTRTEFILELNIYGQNNVTHFPKFSIESKGFVEDALKNNPALWVEDTLQEKLRHNRGEDTLTGGSKIGPHQSEIRVINLDYDYPAEVCSTGEQKALLLSIMLANCRLQSLVCGVSPILLLDEVVAHLDSQRQACLFEEILALNAQAWLTGTHAQVFEPLRGRGYFLTVDHAFIKEG
jgi:DNA replication and repair protein RecF